MADTRVKISSVVSNQLPDYVREDFPLVGQFLTEYYRSIESQGLTLDLFKNIDKYVKIDELTNLVDSTTLTSDVGFVDDTIFVDSTDGFPDSYGLIKIDSEIITYSGITTNTFTGCSRGFSGITSFTSSNNPDELVFEESEISTHSQNATVDNLSILFLKEFFGKVKSQITPGFEERELDSDVDQRVFIKQSKDFYTSKGTDKSFEILFRALYGVDVEVIKPRDYLFAPSDAQYRVCKDLVVEALEGDPQKLENRTLFQDFNQNGIKGARGSVTQVQKIRRNEKDYFVISLDYDYDKDVEVRGSIFGEFSIHPTTKVITPVSVGSTVIDVDSTVGFHTSGTLVTKHSDGISTKITYESKSLTQFYGCSGVTKNIDSQQDLRVDEFAYGYVGVGTSVVCKVRVTGVTEKLNTHSLQFSSEVGDVIEPQSLGIGITNKGANNWFFNIATNFNVKSLELLDASNSTYGVITYDKHNFILGDKANIKTTDGVNLVCNITSIINDNHFTINDQGVLDTTRYYTIEKILSKGNIQKYPELSIQTTNVENIYSKENALYVSSPSIPSYLNESLDVTDRSVDVTGTFSGENLSIANHGFYTGDSITYKPGEGTNKLNIVEGVYFIKKVDSDTVKLAKSRSNIYNGNYITVTGTVTNNSFELTKFSDQRLKAQQLIRKIKNPITSSVKSETKPGQTGILINGVEISNYKSNDSVFYGPLEEIAVVSGGVDYDVINPPVLTVTDSVGSGCSAFCSVEGVLERIEILDGGFDYVDEPIITITGGNGKGAKASANLSSLEHSVEFNALQSAGLVNLSNNTVAFSTFHKFRDGESVIYRPNGQDALGGLTDSAAYHVCIKDAFTISLHKTLPDAISGISSVDLTSYSTGVHNFRSTKFKKILKSISIGSSGSGYTNQRVTTNISGINTASNIVTIKGHGYNDGEIILYTPKSTPIEGLSSKNYIVSKVDDDSFRLAEVGIGSTASNFYFDNDTFVDLKSVGSGTHEFNYPPISVEVKGTIGVSTLTGQDFNAIVQPIFRGSIESIFIENGGLGYGSSEILNYNRQPTFTLKTGSSAQLKPVISNGKIVEVLVLSSGFEYNTPPTIKVEGSGKGAILIPVLNAGVIESITVVSGGLGYNKKDTNVIVTASGSEAQFESRSKQWILNTFERLVNTDKISEDDGVLTEGINSDFEVEFTHLYSPRKLRRSLYSKQIIDGNPVSFVDLSLEDDVEETSNFHSPLFGWAYDGNPIYGPYAYTLPTGGAIKIMKSGYTIGVVSDRPNPLNEAGQLVFPTGSFVQDYEFTDNGDLDEHNGRYCITPEYPNGVYAYFTTIDPESIDSQAPFKNFRRPQFPYFIGNTFKSDPIEFNFDRYSNQKDLDINDGQWYRNTTPYGFLDGNTNYNYLIDPSKDHKQKTLVKSISEGKLEAIGIVTGGFDYAIDDSVVFNNEGSGGAGAVAKVSGIAGKPIHSINVASTIVSNVEFAPFREIGAIIGYSTSPHGIKNKDIGSVSGLSTNVFVSGSSYQIGVQTSRFILANAIGDVTTTGITTYIDIASGQLSFPYIKENDILGIGTERVRVLNVDSDNGRIRILRGESATASPAHPAFARLNQDPRNFIFYQPTQDSRFDYKLNKEIYFNPVESLSIGTSGIGHTITIANPGAGSTQVFLSLSSIYLPDHGLETGDEIIYNSNGGAVIGVQTFAGASSFNLSDNDKLFVARRSKDVIGIATVKVGLGNTGEFRAQVIDPSKMPLYLTGIGTGTYHSFTTNYQNVIKGEVTQIDATVATASTHGMSINDNIIINATIGITTTITVAYNDYNRRLVINPKNFVSGNVSISENTITVLNHGLSDGDKVIHTAGTASGGLKDNQIYFVSVVDRNKISLCNDYYEAIKFNASVIDITSASAGTISQINPPIKVQANQKVYFDLSDSSLSFSKSGVSYAAFDFNLHLDEDCKNVYTNTSNTAEFNVTKSGTVGVSADANLSFQISNSTPRNLYYSMVPVNLSLNTDVKKEIVKDSENIIASSSLITEKNIFNKVYSISGIGSTTFSFNLTKEAGKTLYIPEDGIFNYMTSSRTTRGPISLVSVINGGLGYNKIPGIDKVANLGVTTSKGFGAVLDPISLSIGRIESVDIQDIGFEYSADKTLQPKALLPQYISVDSFYSLKNVGITSVGNFYTTAPDLVVLDGITKKPVDEVVLKYTLGDTHVGIVRNTVSLNKDTPTIIPVNNSNGIKIDSMDFNPGTKDVTVTIGASFSDAADYPFAVGESVLIENISVGVGTTGKGYNSSNYNYKRFKILATDPNIGGTLGTVRYSLEGSLFDGNIPGNFDEANSSGRIIPEKWFPKFGVEMDINDFEKGEIVSSKSASGSVQSWNRLSGSLKVSSPRLFNVGEIIVGESSSTKATIKERISYNAQYKVGSSSIIEKGWKRETGFLNNNLQRLHDNDYYQYFSYALKSTVQLEKWDESVSSLNHTAGFKKFSDLVVENDITQNNQSVGLTTDQIGRVDSIANLDSVLSLNTVPDYDLVTEKTLKVDDTTVVSDEVVFKTKILQDYIESIGNRVLSIDDVSSQFNDLPRTDRFAAVDLFPLTSARHKKFIAYIQDTRFGEERQVYIISMVHNSSTAMLNQYGGVYTYADLGTFDFDILGEEGRLLFYPKKYRANDYFVTTLTYNIADTVAGIGSTDFGDIANVGSATSTVGLGVTTAVNIVGIAKTYRSAKITVSAAATNSDYQYYEVDELTMVHDGTNVELMEYGQVSSDMPSSPLGSAGIGTFGATLSGNYVNISFTPNTGVTTATGYHFNSLKIAMSDTTSSGVGTHTFNTSQISSRQTSIASSTSPVETVVAEYSDAYRSAYYFVSIEDTTNNQYQASEVLVVNDENEVYITEYGVVQTGGNLGDFGGNITGEKVRQLTFQPLANANVQVRVLQSAVGTVNDSVSDNLISFTNASIDTGEGEYYGTETDVKRAFEIKHKQLPIFKRNFLGAESNVVNLTENKVFLPDHYFVTGESLTYANLGAGTTMAVGIKTTTIPGVGSTDKLPSTVFAVKSDDSNIKLAATAEDALKAKPVVLDITAVGIGTSHSLTSKNANSKVLVSLDNVIQTPVVASAVTTNLAGNVDYNIDNITITGITSIFGGDLLQIDDEIMRVDMVGFGATNKLRVKRPWMGTQLAAHDADAMVTKINGNYNIVGNEINFYTAPKGLTPISTTAATPDDVYWTGIATHSTFNGRSFMRSGVTGTSDEPYAKNFIFDDISSGFTGYSTEFTLKSNGANVTGISSDNAIILINQIAQGPSRYTDPINVISNYTLSENSGITSIQFTGSASSVTSDPNTASVPVGGIIISVGSTQGLGYQPLVAAGATAIVSGLGTISSVAIGNSGSGYRSGIQTTVNVGVKTLSTGIPNIEFIGTAAVSNGNIVSVAITNPGAGYTSTNPPEVVFDAPLSYTDIPLVYSNNAGVGTEATVDIVVGAAGSVIDFVLNNQGSGYGQEEILTIGVGGTVGIPTDSTLGASFKEFQISIEKTQTNSFAGWTLGDFLVLDNISNQFDGNKKTFAIKLNGVQKTIKSRIGSPVKVQDTLLVFINDILQIPGDGYIFDGGSFIEFTEAPKVGDLIKLLFYQGTGAVDVREVDILEQVKVGDIIQLTGEEPRYRQDGRLVTKINATDSVDTNTYGGRGINENETYVRPVTWSRQTEDRFIDGQAVSKDRALYEPLIFPSTNLIQSVGLGSTVAFVENVRTFFDNAKENQVNTDSIRIISQDSVVAASATAVVSGLGTISSIVIGNGGIGYTGAPEVTIGNPVSTASSLRASATSSITSGIVTSISVTVAGTGYTSSNPPVVLIAEPKTSGYVEEITKTSYTGDFGIISGVSTTTVGVSTGIVFDLLLPSDSLFRDADVVGTALTVSGIQTGYYFVVSNSNIGNGVTSLNSSGAVVGSGSSFLDNIYEVASVSIAQTSAVSIGQTYVAKVTVSVENYNGLTGLGHSEIFGDYSWGRISINNRSKNKVFNSYNNGLLGISTSPIVERVMPLKSTNYNE